MRHAAPAVSGLCYKGSPHRENLAQEGTYRGSSSISRTLLLRLPEAAPRYFAGELRRAMALGRYSIPVRATRAAGNHIGGVAEV